MNGYLFLKPGFAASIWGNGTVLEKYHLERELPADMDADTVCAISFSGFPDSANMIAGGDYHDMTLHQVYTDYPQLFGSREQLRWEYLPVSMGICHACADLSVQVHPTEEYALKNLGFHGKSESWYFIETRENGDIVLGHNARTMDELKQYIAAGDWSGLLKRAPIKPEGFYSIEAGTLHAIQEGTMFIEVCNPSPVTYRFYDYDRTDENGNKRELNIEKALDNVLIPFEPIAEATRIAHYGEVECITYTENHNFSVFRYQVKSGYGKVTMPKPYLMCFVIRGTGSIDKIEIKAGDGFIISTQIKEFELNGDLTILACHG